MINKTVVAVAVFALATSAWTLGDKAEKQKTRQAALQNQAKITMDAAKKIAVEKEPGDIKSSELENEHGRLIYSFDIKTKTAIHEVNVGAKTGDVVEDSVETAKDEAKEKKQDEAQARSKAKRR